MPPTKGTRPNNHHPTRTPHPHHRSRTPKQDNSSQALKTQQRTTTPPQQPTSFPHPPPLTGEASRTHHQATRTGANHR